MTHTDILREKAEGIFEAMNSRDFTNFEQIITDDVVLAFPGI